MDLLKTEDAASVILFDLRLSESEVEFIAIALDYLLKNQGDAQLHALMTDPKYVDVTDPTETREIMRGMVGELVAMIREHCYPKYLPSRFRGQDPF